MSTFKRLISPLLAITGLTVVMVSANAEVVTLAGFVATNSSASLSASESASGITSATFARGAGLSVRTDFEGYFDSASWSTAPSFPGIADTHYLSLAIEIAPFREVTLDSLQIAYQDAGSAESARRLELRWSLDGFADPLFTDFSVATWPTVDFNNIVLPANGPLTGTIEFRMYGYGASSSVGVLGLTNVPEISVNSNAAAVALKGEVTVVPELNGFTLIMSVFIGLGVLWRARRDRQKRM